jgi:hypothetical protein
VNNPLEFRKSGGIDIFEIGDFGHIVLWTLASGPEEQMILERPARSQTGMLCE